MARFVEKTFGSINTIINNSGLFQSNQNKTSSKYQLSWFLDSKSVERKLKTLDSEQEKEEIIKKYLTDAERRLSEPDVTPEETEDVINFCMTCEALDYPTPFIYIHCLKLAQKGNLQQKKTGYNAAAYFLNPNHELVVLLINTIQKDLLSSNYLEVQLALSSVCNLINVERVHDILHLVEDKLSHAKSSVRKAAILTLGYCLQLINSQSAYQMSFPKLEKALTDLDLEVVSAAICTLFKILQVLPGDYSYLIDSLVELQNQIILRRVPRSMIYCDIPAPWLQIDILKLLKFLYKLPEQSETIVPVLRKTLQQIGLQSTVAHAILYQVVETICCIESPNDLVEMALSSVSTLLKSRNANLKLVGIEALILVVKCLKPSVAVAQQEVIMECLKLPDETLQLKTLELLYHLANPYNVQAVCKKMLDFLISAINDDKRRELALKILKLAKDYSDKREWFVSVILSVFLDAGQILSPCHINDIVNHVLQEDLLRESAKKSCLDLCRQKQKLSPELIKLTASVLTNLTEFKEVLPHILPLCDESSSTWLLVSLTEIILKWRQITPDFAAYLKSLNLTFYAADQVLKQLLHIIDSLPCFNGFDANEKVDPTLTFLDEFLVQSLADSGSCYQPPSYRSNTVLMEETKPVSKVETTLSHSDISIAQESSSNHSQSSGIYNLISSPSTSFQSMSGKSSSVFHASYSAKNVWTEEGRKATDLNTKTESATADSDQTDKTNQDYVGLFAGIS